MFDWQELEEAQQEVEEKMSKKLQMPPVMAERDAASKVISWSWIRKQGNLWFKVMDNPWWIDVLPITN